MQSVFQLQRYHSHIAASAIVCATPCGTVPSLDGTVACPFLLWSVSSIRHVFTSCFNMVWTQLTNQKPKYHQRTEDCATSSNKRDSPARPFPHFLRKGLLTLWNSIMYTYSLPCGKYNPLISIQCQLTSENYKPTHTLGCVL